MLQLCQILGIFATPLPLSLPDSANHVPLIAHTVYSSASDTVYSHAFLAAEKHAFLYASILGWTQHVTETTQRQDNIFDLVISQGITIDTVSVSDTTISDHY